MEYIYNRESKLYFYDENLKKKYYFKNEILENQNEFEVSEEYRFIIDEEICNLKKEAIYISTLKCLDTNDGKLLKTAGYNILLVPVGENIYLLAYCDCKEEQMMFPILYTFIKDNNVAIDVSKYDYIFNTFKKHYLYLKKKN